ncbi:hypothetical protein OH77DRAFT_22757 [Trametes cingulata]|nr:hypothetical protein OH77DRAFT_22757 [Trametes cingulata]
MRDHARVYLAPRAHEIITQSMGVYPATSEAVPVKLAFFLFLRLFNCTPPCFAQPFSHRPDRPLPRVRVPLSLPSSPWQGRTSTPMCTREKPARVMGSIIAHRYLERRLQKDLVPSRNICGASSAAALPPSYRPMRSCGHKLDAIAAQPCNFIVSWCCVMVLVRRCLDTTPFPRWSPECQPVGAHKSD